eukprot:4690477-Ditylum_brightwellii.AAC.2
MFFDSADAVAEVDGVAHGAMLELSDPTPGRVSITSNVDPSGRRAFQDEREYQPMCEDRARAGYNSGMGEIFRKVCAVSPIPTKALHELSQNCKEEDCENTEQSATWTEMNSRVS